MKSYHIQSRKSWEGFTHDGNFYCLKHLDAHEVEFKGEKKTYTFIVTYGLHCFTKEDQPHTIETSYSDSFEERPINLERYHLSKYLRNLIEKLHTEQLLHETTKEKYFTFYDVNNMTGVVEKCKVCLCFFKENRLLRIHVITAFFDRESNGKTPNKGCSVFKIAVDISNAQKNRSIPKEATRGKGDPTSA